MKIIMMDGMNVEMERGITQTIRTTDIIVMMNMNMRQKTGLKEILMNIILVIQTTMIGIAKY